MMAIIRIRQFRTVLELPNKGGLEHYNKDLSMRSF